MKSALDAIPNDLDYDRWRDIIFSIHHATGGSDDGLALAHEFSARSPKHNPEFLDTRVWPYVRSDRGGAVITERTLFAAASKQGWIDPDVLADFEVLPSDPVPATGKFTFKPAAEFAVTHSQRWIIKKVLPQAEIAMMYGESGSGKSFFALDLICAVARGIDWRGNKTTKGRVAYIAAEGAGGFRLRLKAYAQQQGMLLDDLDVHVLGDAPNLMQTSDVAALKAGLAPLGPLAIIVVDTLAVTTPGASENAGEDMGKAIAHCKVLHKATGAIVLVIHHSGKDASRGARGWSGIRAAVDAEIEIVRSDNDRLATVTKLKDGEDGAGFAFKLTTVALGLDEDGETITSCVVAHGLHAAKAAKLRPLKDLSLRMWHVLLELQTLSSENPTEHELETALKAHEKAEGRNWYPSNYKRSLDTLKGHRVRVEGGRVVVLAEDGKEGGA